MKTCSVKWLTVVSILAITTLDSGCSRFTVFGPRFSATAEQDLKFSAEGVGIVQVDTRNGRISIVGSESVSSIDAHIVITARAPTMDRATECLEEILLTTDRDGDTQTLGWEWKTVRPSDCQGSVAFDVATPSRLAARVSSRNGSIAVKNIDGDCDATTRNGSIVIETGSRNVQAQSRNGDVRLTAPVDVFYAETRNGSITADVAGQSQISGVVSSRNGSITLTLGVDQSAEIECQTRNGGISCDAALDEISSSRSSFSGRKGDPEGTLKVRSRNGAIRIRER